MILELSINLNKTTMIVPMKMVRHNKSFQILHQMTMTCFRIILKHPQLYTV